MPLLCLEGVPDLPGAPQDEAGLTRKFETSHVGGSTYQTTPISRSTLVKNSMPGHLFEGNPVDEGTIRRVGDTPEHCPENPNVPYTARQGARNPLNKSRGKRSSILQIRRGLTLLFQLCRDPAIGVRNGEEA